MSSEDERSLVYSSSNEANQLACIESERVASYLNPSVDPGQVDLTNAAHIQQEFRSWIQSSNIGQRVVLTKIQVQNNQMIMNNTGVEALANTVQTLDENVARNMYDLSNWLNRTMEGQQMVMHSLSILDQNIQNRFQNTELYSATLEEQNKNSMSLMEERMKIAYAKIEVLEKAMAENRSKMCSNHSEVLHEVGRSKGNIQDTERKIKALDEKIGKLQIIQETCEQKQPSNTKMISHITPVKTVIKGAITAQSSPKKEELSYDSSSRIIEEIQRTNNSLNKMREDIQNDQTTIKFLEVSVKSLENNAIWLEENQKEMKTAIELRITQNNNQSTNNEDPNYKEMLKMINELKQRDQERGQWSTNGNGNKEQPKTQPSERRTESTSKQIKLESKPFFEDTGRNRRMDRKGIKRKGNSCYINAAVQALLSMNEVMEILEQEQFKSCRLISSLRRIAKEVKTGRTPSNEEIFEYTKEKRNAGMTTNVNESTFFNSGDMLGLLIDWIEQEISSVSQETVTKWEKALRPKIECITECQRCQGSKTLKDEFPLKIELKPDHTKEKDDLWRIISRTFLTYSDKAHCNVCETETKTYGTRILRELPKHVILGIEKKTYPECNLWNGKIEMTQTMSLYCMRNSSSACRQTYAIESALLHNGSQESGHYKCIVRNDNGSWTLYDDEKVETMASQKGLKLVKKRADTIIFNRIKSYPVEPEWVTRIYPKERGSDNENKDDNKVEKKLEFFSGRKQTSPPSSSSEEEIKNPPMQIPNIDLHGKNSKKKDNHKSNKRDKKESSDEEDERTNKKKGHYGANQEKKIRKERNDKGKSRKEYQKKEYVMKGSQNDKGGKNENFPLEDFLRKVNGKK